MKHLVRKNILKVKPYTPGKPIEEVRRELNLSDVIKLASNENALGPSPKAIAAIKKSLSDLNRYPDANSFYLKRRLSILLGVKEENLILGNGSDEVIGFAIRAFVNEGDEVVIAQPTFLIYEIASQIQNATIKFVPLTKAMKYDLASMRKAITERTKIVFIANPDNPTGTYVSKAELEAFLRSVPSSTIVFLDEAYFEFADYEFKDYPNGLDYLSMPNVIVSRSFSKAYGLAGLRVGYGVANAETIGFMERVREPFNINLLAQNGALAALDDKAFLKKTLAFVVKEKKFLNAELKKMRLKTFESATNFILVDVKADCKKVFGELLKRGVIVRDMKAWGFDTFVRVTVGKRSENIRFIKALKEIL